jgi:hypothetical protein
MAFAVLAAEPSTMMGCSAQENRAAQQQLIVQSGIPEDKPKIVCSAGC